MAASQLRKDGQWLKTIDELLGGDRQKHLAARDKLWREVLGYIEFGAHLKIGPLSDDPDARRDIGCVVLKKLEANDYAHLREWRYRQRCKQDHASWWGFIKMVTRCCAIDYARTSSLNIARRGEPFDWIRVDVAEPAVFDETPAADFLSHCTEQAMYDYLASFQGARGTSVPEPPPPPPVRLAVPRDRS